jgi:uncharacterized pyridoxal phosphate-containing UPF0001 family protein
VSNKKKGPHSFIQVNSSGEESKSGVEPGQEVQLAEYIVKECAGVQQAVCFTMFLLV